jgi:TP901 family phage tail tape measure protein
VALSASGSGASRSVVYRLIADATGVLAGTRQASAAMKKLGSDVTAVSKEGDRTRKSFDTLGRGAGRAGLVAAAGLGIMVAKAAQFEQAISNVAAATHESEQNMGLLRDAAIEAGARTQYSATQAADAITELAKAGVATADILGKNGALNGALNLAAAGQLEVKDAAEDMATALSQFKLPGTDAAHVADLLAAGAGKAQGEVADMANALKYAGVPASNLGVSIEETAGSIALLAKNGVIGEQAGTSLRGILSSLTSPSKIAKKTLDELGISMFNNKGKFIGLAGVADQLQSHMKTLTDEERANALGKIFGNEQLQAANVLYREGAKGVEAWTRNVNEAGYAADTAKIKTDNLRGDLERLGGALDTLFIKGGSSSQGPLRGLVKGLTSAVDALAELPAPLQNAAGGMAAITAITGGGLWFGTKVIRGISDTREALGNLKDAGYDASKGLKLAAAAGAGFTAALVTVEVIKAIQRATDEALPGLNTMKKRLIEIAETGSLASLGTQFDDISDSVDRLKEAQSGIFSGDFGSVNPTALSDAIGSAIGIQARSLRDASQEISSLDAALAGLVTSGKPDIAAQAITNIAGAAGLTSDEMATLRANLPAYQDALDGMETSAQEAADAHEGMGKKVRIAGQDIHFTADQIENAQKAYDQQREDAGNVASSFLDISKNVKKAKVSLSDWIDQMNKQAEALENFTANAVKASNRGVADGLIAQLEQLGPQGALRLKQLADASDEEIDRANKAYRRGQKAIEAYTDATTTVPDELRTDVKVIDDDARRKERALRQKFATFPKTINTQIKWDNRAADRGLDHVEARLARLRQLAIITPRIAHTESRLGNGFATGGAVRGPGSKTSDSIPAYLSTGEYVIKAAAVDRYGSAFFDRLNAMHFAGGGYVGGGGSQPIDLQALANLVASARPIANQMTIRSNNYQEFEQQQAQIRRAAFSTGWGG